MRKISAKMPHHNQKPSSAASQPFQPTYICIFNKNQRVYPRAKQSQLPNTQPFAAQSFATKTRNPILKQAARTRGLHAGSSGAPRAKIETGNFPERQTNFKNSRRGRERLLLGEKLARLAKTKLARGTLGNDPRAPARRARGCTEACGP